MSATIDGAAWAADANGTRVTTKANEPGVYAITGVKVISPTTSQALAINFFNLSAPGTYPIGVSPQIIGGFSTYLDGTTAYSTPLDGNGTATITALTSSRIAGTFSFTAVAQLGGATRTVTNGSFDLAITTPVGTLPANAGSIFNAQIAGAPFQAAVVAIVANGNPPGSYAFSGSAQPGYSIVLTLSSITGPGTYALSNTGPIEIMTAQNVSSQWSSQVAGSTGSVVITSLTAARIQGTFSGTLQSGGASSLAITNGVFSVGLP